MSERFEIFPQNITKDGTLIIIQKGLKLYNISDVVDLLNELNDENKELKEKIQLLQIELNADAKQYKIFIDIIDEANDLICSHLSKHYQRKWRTFCKNKEYDFE